MQFRVRNLIFITICLFSQSLGARVGVEAGAFNGRYDVVNDGQRDSFFTNSAPQYKLYIEGNNYVGWNYGLSVTYQNYKFSETSRYTFVKDKAANILSDLSLRYIFKSGFFFFTGLNHSTSPIFTINESSEVDYTNASSLNYFLGFGSYYFTRYGGGEFSFKVQSLSQVQAEGGEFSGVRTSVYMNLFLNRGRNFGLYIDFSNERYSGSYEQLNEARSAGIIFQF